MDLKFPHHENEIAQSEAASGHRYANVWMHNGFVQVNEEKMSKSLGNFFTVREVLQRYQPEVVRLFILSSHYRGPLNYADENLDHAKSSLTRLYTALRGLPVVEELLEEYAAAVSLVFSGHTHRAREGTLGPVRGYNVGGDYHFKRLLVVDWPLGAVQEHTFGDPTP